MDGYEKPVFLGRGTYGRVYKIVRKSDGIQFVLKTIPFDDISVEEQEITLNEVKIMSRINHQRFIKFYDAFVNHGILHIVMEFAPGGDLYNLLQQHKDNDSYIDENILKKFLIQLCEGLAYLQDIRILHRDLKLQNIFLDKDGNIKIGDMGLGRILGSKSAHARTSVGTPLYFSPELCQGEPYDHKSDIWALGCVMYQLATFNTPFSAPNQIVLAQRIVSEAPCELPKYYSDDFRYLIYRMLTKSADERPNISDIYKFTSFRHWSLEIEEKQLELHKANLAKQVKQMEVTRQEILNLSKEMKEEMIKAKEIHEEELQNMKLQCEELDVENKQLKVENEELKLKLTNADKQVHQIRLHAQHEVQKLINRMNMLEDAYKQKLDENNNLLTPKSSATSTSSLDKTPRLTNSTSNDNLSKQIQMTSKYFGLSQIDKSYKLIMKATAGFHDLFKLSKPYNEFLVIIEMNEADLLTLPRCMMDILIEHEIEWKTMKPRPNVQFLSHNANSTFYLIHVISDNKEDTTKSSKKRITSFRLFIDKIANWPLHAIYALEYDEDLIELCKSKQQDLTGQNIVTSTPKSVQINNTNEKYEKQMLQYIKLSSKKKKLNIGPPIRGEFTTPQSNNKQIDSQSTAKRKKKSTRRSKTLSSGRLSMYAGNTFEKTRKRLF